MDPLEIVESTADAAFATDEKGRIVIWNREAERMLGHVAARVLGKPCHEILCGADVFGNRFCDQDCNLSKMVRRGEPIRRFQLDMRTAAGRVVRVALSLLFMRGARPSQFTLVHLFQPVDGEGSDVPSSDGKALAEIPVGSPSSQPPLSVREVEVLRHLAEGSGTREIADALCISVATVRTHVHNILGKLEVHSQVQAVSLALRKRLI